MRHTLLSLLFLFSTMALTAQCLGPTAVSMHHEGSYRFYSTGGGAVFGATLGSPGFSASFDEGPLKSLIFSSGVWFGGLTSSEGLLVAVANYPMGADPTDYFPGPLLTQGNDLVLEDCGLEFDRHYLLHREIVERHKSYFECINNPECDLEEAFPFGYEVHQSLLDYPAYTGDLEIEGAPYYDSDGDGMYDPFEGDFPLFAQDPLADECCYALNGDYCYLWFSNDLAGSHTVSSGAPLSIELENIIYGFYSDEPEGYTYHRVKVTNRSLQTVHQARMGYFIDPDIGNPYDDLAGCDPDRDLVFFYNGDSFDETFGQPGWGGVIPTVGFSVLRAPFSNLTDQEVHHMMLNDPFAFSGMPSNPVAFYNWLNGNYVNGQPMGGGMVPEYFPQAGYPTGNESYTPGDVRALVGTPPFQLAAGAHFCAESVYLVNPNLNADGPLESTQQLGEMRDEAHDRWSTCFECVPPAVKIMVEPLNDGWSFINLSEGDAYEWDFGDGTTSQERFPHHAYTSSGEKTVTLTVSNACGSATGSALIDVVVSVDEHKGALTSGWRIYPNPATSEVTVDATEFSGEAWVRIYHPTGQVVHESRMLQAQHRMDIGHLAAGLYIIAISDRNGFNQQMQLVKP